MPQPFVQGFQKLRLLPRPIAEIGDYMGPCPTLPASWPGKLRIGQLIQLACEKRCSATCHKKIGGRCVGGVITRALTLAQA